MQAKSLRTKGLVILILTALMQVAGVSAAQAEPLGLCQVIATCHYTETHFPYPLTSTPVVYSTGTKHECNLLCDEIVTQAEAAHDRDDVDCTEISCEWKANPTRRAPL